MRALHSRPFSATLTPEDLRFLRSVADDTEDAPWMVMNDRQWREASALFWSLQIYAQHHPVSWYPGGMLPLTYLLPGESHLRQVAPDVFASTVPVQERDSLRVDLEGMPPFVMETVSKSSVRRDLEEKERIYRALGAQEYAIVRLDLAEARLEGYRRSETGAWNVWGPDAQGQLWSEVLGLGLVMRGREVRAVTREGELLRTPPEAEAARQRAEAARQQAEEELARLRAALERLTQGEGQASSE
jgi:hypothetical protein